MSSEIRFECHFCRGSFADLPYYGCCIACCTTPAGSAYLDEAYGDTSSASRAPIFRAGMTVAVSGVTR